MSDLLSFNPATTALLVMDYQVVVLENFITSEAAATVLGQTAKLLTVARSADMPVVYVTVGFRPGYPEIDPNNALFTWLKDSGLFAPGTDGTRIHPAVEPRSDEPVIVKHRLGAFTGTDLDMLLRAKRIDTLLLAGITTGGVTLSTLRQAFDLDYRLAVVQDCCADMDPEHHAMLLEKVFPTHATMISAEQITQSLARQ